MPAVINQFIDGLSSCLGVGVSVLLVGPVPSQGGRVGINRYVANHLALIYSLTTF